MPSKYFQTTALNEQETVFEVSQIGSDTVGFIFSTSTFLNTNSSGQLLYPGA